jgi:hypothetical protein
MQERASVFFFLFTLSLDAELSSAALSKLPSPFCSNFVGFCRQKGTQLRNRMLCEKATCRSKGIYLDFELTEEVGLFHGEGLKIK